MALLTVTNPTGQAIALAPGSGLTPFQGDPPGLILADRTAQLRQQPCQMSVGRSGSNSVPRAGIVAEAAAAVASHTW